MYKQVTTEKVRLQQWNVLTIINYFNPAWLCSVISYKCIVMWLLFIR